MRDLKAELAQLVEAGKVKTELIDLKSYQLCLEAINRAIAAEELCNDRQDRAVMAENQVKGLQEENATLKTENDLLCQKFTEPMWQTYDQVREENARLTAQVAGLRDVLEFYSNKNHWPDGPAVYPGGTPIPPIMKDNGARARQVLASPDPGEKYRANCAIANKESDGKCLGYSHGESDDEPIEQCKNCAKYTGHEAELEGRA